MVGLQCAAPGDERDAHLHCCAACGEVRVLSVDLAARGVDFECGLAGYACSKGARSSGARVAAEGSAALGDAALSMQTCSVCGASHAAAQLDLRTLGLDFHCGLLGRQCWQTIGELSPRDLGEGPGQDGDAGQHKAAVLSLVDRQRLLSKLGKGNTTHHEPRLEREEVKQTLRLQGSSKMERFRDGAVVTTRGERFLTVCSKAPTGSGTELAGILGAGSRGRLGLGLRKMTKEDAEKCSLSNKERGHIKKKVAHAKSEREAIVFETKKNMHQLKHAAILPASAVRMN